MTDMQPLYDLAPALELMALGIVIALGPLAWVWWRGRGGTPVRRLQALTVLTLFLTFDLVLFGAAKTGAGNGLDVGFELSGYLNPSVVVPSAEVGRAR